MVTILPIPKAYKGIHAEKEEITQGRKEAASLSFLEEHHHHSSSNTHTQDKETSTWRLNWFGIEASLYSQITYVRREARGCSFVLSLYLHLVH